MKINSTTLLLLTVLTIAPVVSLAAPSAEDATVHTIYAQLDNYLNNLNALLLGDITFNGLNQIDALTNDFNRWLTDVNHDASDHTTRFLANSLSAVLQ